MESSIAQIVGRNARSMRVNAGLTLDEVAAVAKVRGLPWTTGRVGDFESGRVSPTLPTLFAYALTLADATGTPVRLTNLLEGDGEVTLNDALTVPLADLRDALSGKGVGRKNPKPVLRDDATLVIHDGESVAVQFDEPVGYVTFPQWLMREADYRLARDLGVAPDKAQAAMLALWGKPFTAARDEEAGPDANAQRKGQISRRLKSELEQQLKSGRNRGHRK